MTPTELAIWLTTNDPSPLPPEDRNTLAAALAELAVSQALLVKQSMLLDSYNADHTDIESTLYASLADIALIDTADASIGAFDFEKAKQARTELASKLAQARTLRDVLSLAISSVRAITAR